MQGPGGEGHVVWAAYRHRQGEAASCACLGDRPAPGQALGILLKSILDIDQLRAREQSPLAELYLHGKLLYTWVLEKRARRRGGEDWNRLDQPRRATLWRIWKLLRRELAIAISGVLHWDLSRWSASLEVMQERPRRRQLQTLPDRVNRLIAYCQTNGLSNI